jgi:hypothetical protein
MVLYGFVDGLPSIVVKLPNLSKKNFIKFFQDKNQYPINALSFGDISIFGSVPKDLELKSNGDFVVSVKTDTLGLKPKVSLNLTLKSSYCQEYL